ncbi:MAG: DedA family protein [Anaerolineaceae bacterium]|jgi:membrane protein DedA with SNARE-associated domain|nr:DedA family protein [Anaerolineaceae bacterium]
MDLGAILDAIKIWTETVISTLGYPGLVLVMFLENIFPPIPSEVVLPLAGNLTNAGRFTMFGVIFWGMIGALLGALVFYYLGKWFSEERLRRLIEKYGKWALLEVADFDRAVDFFEKHGPFTIFFGRMVPIVRSLISIPAGLAKMNLLVFCFYTILGTSLWNFVLAIAGRILGKEWHRVVDWVGTYQNVVLAVGVLVVGIFVFTRVRRLITNKQTEA